MIKTGTSGFSFDDWKGSIYPSGLKKNSWLVFYVAWQPGKRQNIGQQSQNNQDYSRYN